MGKEKPVLIVGINGSPIKDGNTGYLISKALEQVEGMGGTSHLIQAGEIMKQVPVPFCTSCSTPCRGACIKDTPLHVVHQILKEADGFIIGSPVYFGTVSAQLKAFWDKARYMWMDKVLLNKVGGAVAVGASRFGGQEGTLRTIQDIMLIHGITVVNPTFGRDKPGHCGVAAQKPSWEDQAALDELSVLVKRIYEVSLATRSIR
ncbi:MAG: flavodoxin family protein [Bacillota bacterium]